MKIYRWHIGRKLDSYQLSPENQDMLDVTITPSTEDFVKFFMEKGVETVRDLPSDKLTWWHIGENYELEGTTSENSLLLALTDKNMLSEAFPPKTTDRKRRIIEDMVFLQLIEDEGVNENLWEKLRNVGRWPDVTDLVKVEGARWLDYTRPSRRMAKELYLRVLKDIDDTKEDTNAPKR